MLLFTRFLYRLVARDYNISLEAFGSEKEGSPILNYYNLLIKADLPSAKQDTLLVDSFNMFIDLLP